MVEATIPPTIGAAMHRLTSEPVPVLHMIGSRPAIVCRVATQRQTGGGDHEPDPVGPHERT